MDKIYVAGMGMMEAQAKQAYNDAARNGGVCGGQIQQAPIDASLEELHRAISQANSALEELASRLSPILQVRPCEAETATGESPVSCQMEGQIVAAVQGARQIHARLHMIRNSLCI